jgi:[ribosomal protein S5]-alanine N-acetyltransferase
MAEEKGRHISMNDIQLVPLDLDAVTRIEADLDSYCAANNMHPANNGKLTQDMTALWKKFMLSVGALPPWIGYLTVDSSSNIIVGTCAFKGNPNKDNTVEIAYFTFPDFEGKGYATAMARALIGIALAQPETPQIIAHTLPRTNASTKVLQKVGMKFACDVIDPEDGPVWRWQYEQSTP